jgi:hypothetical protein
VAGYLVERLHREAIIDSQSDTTMALLNDLLAYPGRAVLNWLPLSPYTASWI